MMRSLWCCTYELVLNNTNQWWLKSANLDHLNSIKELSAVYKKQKNYLESSIWTHLQIQIRLAGDT